MSDRSTELELALSIAADAARGILAEWEGLDEDGKEDPSNIAVHNLAVETLAAIKHYRDNRIIPAHEAAIEAIEEL